MSKSKKVVGRGGTMRSLRTIEDMEKYAAEQFDSVASKRIRGEWLQVERCKDDDRKYFFTYKWGKNKVTRTIAINILLSAES